MAPRAKKVVAEAAVVEVEEPKVVENKDETSGDEQVKAKPKTTVKKTKVVKVVDELEPENSDTEKSDVKVSDSETSGDDSVKVVKAKASRKGVSLDDVMTCLERGDIKKAKDKLAKFIEKFGAEGPKRKTKATSSSDDNAEPKPKTEYQKFFSTELKKLADQENKKNKDDRIPPKERMRIVAGMWTAKKNSS